jgi:hypothetical protein
VEGRHFEVMTFPIGNSAETLYLYLTATAAKVFAPTALSIQLVSFGFAIAVMALIGRTVKRISPEVPLDAGPDRGRISLALPLPRSGLGAIAAPLFAAAFALLLDRAERLSLETGVPASPQERCLACPFTPTRRCASCR